MAKKRGANEGTIFQRKDGRWCGILSLGWENCKRKRKSFYGPTEANVQDQMTKAKNDVRLGFPVSVERQTVKEFLDRWLEESVKPSVRPLTHQQYSQHVRLYLGPVLGRHRLSKLRPQHVQAFVNFMLKKQVAPKVSRKKSKSAKSATPPTPRTLSPRTVQLSLAILRHALDQAAKWNLVGSNVAKLVDSPRLKRHETKPLTPDEARTFLAAINGKRWNAAYLIALTLGLREGELLGLRWQDVDLDGRTLTVNQTVQRIRSETEGEGSSLEFCEPKTNRSRRTLSLSDAVIAAIKAHRVSQNKARLAAGSEWHDDGLIFTTSIGTPIEKSNLFRDFKRILKNAKLPSIRFHDLRHSTASLLLAQGVHPRAIMELLGHSRIGVTMDTYAHVMPAMMSDVADKMDAILAG